MCNEDNKITGESKFWLIIAFLFALTIGPCCCIDMYYEGNAKVIKAQSELTNLCERY